MVLPAFMRIFKSSKTEEDVAASKAVDQPGVTAANKPPGLRYTVKDIPPAWVCVLLGFQHYLTFLGSTVLIPHLLVPAMGGNNEGEVLCSPTPTSCAAPLPPAARQGP
ncbi:hypothetical protein QJQ45_021779 [Haematococcus lacustris]|nr:hypothetical protein QJQ45_021779 [Haematococcus lacustris]